MTLRVVPVGSRNASDSRWDVKMTGRETALHRPDQGHPPRDGQVRRRDEETLDNGEPRHGNGLLPSGERRVHQSVT